ncbi:hypothetical protein [Pontibacter populi]|uniref:Lipoprotein n=1 Tax=Pontibacter populi TaxID=890055 RepID=A0ABV1RRN4_9BACT
MAVSLLSVVFAGCKPDEPEVKRKAVSKLSEDSRYRLALVSEARDELDDWFEFYGLEEDADTLFRLREIWDTDELAFPASANWQQLYKEHDELFLKSPDETKVLDIYTYNHEFTKKSRRRVTVKTINRDSEVATINPETGEKVRLMYCADACQFEMAWWRNNDEIIVVGLIQETGKSEFYPALWHINTYTNHIRQYTSLKPAKPAKKGYYLQDEVFYEL